MLVWQCVEVAIHCQIYRDRVAAHEIARMPFERGLQTEVVQHTRAKAES